MLQGAVWDLGPQGKNRILSPLRLILKQSEKGKLHLLPFSTMDWKLAHQTTSTTIGKHLISRGKLVCLGKASPGRWNPDHRQ